MASEKQYLQNLQTIKNLKIMPNKDKKTEIPQCVQTDVSGSSFEHYMIYVNGRFVKDVYSFAEVQDYYNKYFLCGKITYEKVY